MANISSAVILAPDEKGRLPVFGIPAVRRLVLLAKQIGVRTIFLIGCVNPLRPAVSDLLSPEAFHQVEDPESLGQVVDELAMPKTEPALVLKANHVVDAFSLNRLKDSFTGPELHFIATKETGGTDPIYVANPAHLVSLLRVLWSSDTSPLKIQEPAQYVQGAPGLPYTIDQGEDRAKMSEGKLVAALAFQTEERDGLLARHLDRQVSRLISKRLAHTGVTPNQITLVGAAIGLAGALFLSRPGYWPQLVGSLLFLFFAVIDGVDGEVSRLKLEGSQFGYYLDMVTDNIVIVAIFAGIAVGLYHTTGADTYLKLLLILVGGFGLCAISVYHNILRRSQDELKRLPRITRLMTLFINSDFAYLILALALIHRLHWFLWGAAVGTYLFAATLWALRFYEEKATR